MRLSLHDGKEVKDNLIPQAILEIFSHLLILLDLLYHKRFSEYHLHN